MFRLRRGCILPLVAGVALVPGADVAQAQNAKRRGGEVQDAWPANARRTGPVGADRDSSSGEWGEYHTWGTSAAGSWLLIRAATRQLLFDS